MTDFMIDEIVRAVSGTVLFGKERRLRITRIVTDSRKDCSNALFIPIKGEIFDGHAYLGQAIKMGAAAVLTEPEVEIPPNVAEQAVVIEVANTTTAYQALGRYHRNRINGLKVVAITGSSGKTSTKEMLRSIFIAAYGADAVLATEGNTNNQIGVPQNLLRLTPLHKVAVIEMGTNHHGEIEPLSRTALPDVAVITFIGSCHLEFLGSIDGVAQEKAKIFSGLNHEGIAVIPAEGGGQYILEHETSGIMTFRFGLDFDGDLTSRYLGGNLNGSSIELYFKGIDKTVKIDWKLSGRHQASNAAAAAAAAFAMGVPINKIVKGLSTCTLPGMRMKITERDGVTWINDAYNANPDSMSSSLEWLSEFIESDKFVLIMGDMLEIGETSQTEHLKVLNKALNLFASSEMKLVAVGKEMCHAKETLNEGKSARISFYPDSTEAAKALANVIGPGMSVFLKGSRGIKLEVIEQEL